MMFFSLIFISVLVWCIEVTHANRKLIVVLIDGVRNDYLSDPNLKGFHRIASNGVAVPYVLPIYPSVSYPNWYSLVTGLYAENHGFISNYMYDNGSEMFFRMIPDSNATDALWWNEAEPIWITAEKNNMSSAMYWWGGCEVEIKGYHPMICERQTSLYSFQGKKDYLRKIDDVIEMFKKKTFFSSDSLSLVLMYYGYVDISGHHFGINSTLTKNFLYLIDGILEEMHNKLMQAKLNDEVNIMIVSDHGMTDVTNAKYVSLEKYKTYIKYQVSAETESMIIPEQGMLDELYTKLKQANLEGVSIYKKEEIPLKYHVKKSKRMTPLYLVADPGYLILGLTDPGKNKNLLPSLLNSTKGEHGYDPEQSKDMRTIFMASGPDFKEGYVNEPINIIDIYNMMCYSLDLNPLPNNGSWNRVKLMLKPKVSNTKLP